MIGNLRKHQILHEAKQYAGMSLYQIIKQRDDLSALTADLSEVRTNPIPSGLILFSDGKYKIYINSQCGENRKRFTLAHELGHYFLHREYLTQKWHFIDDDNTLYNKPWYRDLTDEIKNMEEEANFFAAEILMPENVVREAYSKNDNLNDLADFFSVSTEAMFYRLKNLSLSA